MGQMDLDLFERSVALPLQDKWLTLEDRTRQGHFEKFQSDNVSYISISERPLKWDESKTAGVVNALFPRLYSESPNLDATSSVDCPDSLRTQLVEWNESRRKESRYRDDDKLDSEDGRRRHPEQFYVWVVKLPTTLAMEVMSLVKRTDRRVSRQHFRSAD